MTVWRDPSLPHQIVLRFRQAPGRGTMEIAITCNCLGLRSLASRARWDDPREPMRIWREHEQTASRTPASTTPSPPAGDRTRIRGRGHRPGGLAGS